MFPNGGPKGAPCHVRFQLDTSLFFRASEAIVSAVAAAAGPDAGHPATRKVRTALLDVVDAAALRAAEPAVPPLPDTLLDDEGAAAGGSAAGGGQRKGKKKHEPQSPASVPARTSPERASYKDAAASAPARPQPQEEPQPGEASGPAALNDEQRRVVIDVLSGNARGRPYVLFGPPGTGKTVTVVEAAVSVFRADPDALILLCAPTPFAADILCSRVRPAAGAPPLAAAAMMEWCPEPPLQRDA